MCNILNITINELFEGKKLTREEIISKSEKNVISLMMDLNQLKVVEMLTQILIAFGIAITMSSGFIFIKLNQKIIFIIIGLFVWLFGRFLKVKIRKTIDQLEK